MEIEIVTFDTTTPTGWRKAIQFEKDNPQYKLINCRLDFNWFYEKNDNEE